MDKIFKKIINEVHDARIGIFWFSKDYTEIIDVKGEQKLQPFELTRNDMVEPIGIHALYDMPRDQPRGRIFYADKLFQIFIGEDCVIDDSGIINMVKETFGLKPFNVQRFKVRRHYLWNTEHVPKLS